MWYLRISMCVAAAVSLFSSSSLRAISVGQVDTFEAAGFSGWRNGIPGNEAANLEVVAGGIGGANDHYLQVSSGFVGGEFHLSRLLTLNRSQWIGDYATPGVTAISMDLRLFVGTTRSMRIAFLEEEGGTFAPGYVSPPITLPNDGNWHLVEFFLSTLTPINSPHPLDELLSNTGGIMKELRIYPSAGFSIIGDLANLRIGIDNITAVGPALQAGDFDGDGDVDGADFVAWQTNFPKASGATLDEGDADGDGDVDGADFVVWQTNFPFTPGSESSPVPEPAAGIIAILALIATAIHLRRLNLG